MKDQERPENSYRLLETKEKEQINAMWRPRKDPRAEKEQWWKNVIFV